MKLNQYFYPSQLHMYTDCVIVKFLFFSEVKDFSWQQIFLSDDLASKINDLEARCFLFALKTEVFYQYFET